MLGSSDDRSDVNKDLVEVLNNASLDPFAVLRARIVTLPCAARSTDVGVRKEVDASRKTLLHATFNQSEKTTT